MQDNVQEKPDDLVEALKQICSSTNKRINVQDRMLYALLLSQWCTMRHQPQHLEDLHTCM